jgi:lysyl-tRNA synthetase class 2
VDRELLQERARIISAIRRFFDERAYIETDTPILAPDLIPESCLEVFETAFLPPEGSRTRQKQAYFLVPSPEIWMKKLIAAHRVNLYQLCKCFRNGESVGRLHSPEFTMLEYYTMDADYEDSITITEELVAFLLPETARRSLCPPFARLTMDEAFVQCAGFSLFDAVERGTLPDEARRLGLEPPEGIGVAALYDLIFVQSVEPNLPRDRPLVLLDYPAFVPCLAQKKPDGKTVERWELYVRGIELANCYSEETDPEAVRAYFAAEAALVSHAVDNDYWKTFLPRCSGVALGVDRLIMSLFRKSTIDSVLPFPMK